MRKYIISCIIVFSLLFCCGAAWHTILLGDTLPMEGHAACGMGDVNSQPDSGHTYSIVSSRIILLKNITQRVLFVFALVMILFVLVYDRLRYYVTCTRDRYGGFRLFSHFVSLFRLGILNPKLF